MLRKIITLSLPYTSFRSLGLERQERARRASQDLDALVSFPPTPRAPQFPHLRHWSLHWSLGSPRLATPPPERDLARCCRCSSLKGADRSVLNAEADTGRFLILPFSHLIRKIERRTVPFFQPRVFYSSPPPSLSFFFYGNVEVSNISVQWERGGNFRFSGLSVVRLQKFWALPLQRNRRPIDGQRGSHRGNRHRSKNRRRSFAPRVSAPR